MSGRYAVCRVQCLPEKIELHETYGHFDNLDEAIGICNERHALVGQNIVMDFGEKRVDGGYSHHGKIVHIQIKH